jgi:GNAT superfamily N-acetyltransferase
VQLCEFHPSTASAAELDEYVQVELAASRYDEPAEPTPTVQSRIARLTRPQLPGRRTYDWIARPAGGEPAVGVASLSLVGDQYSDQAGIGIAVHRDYRRRGLGTALLHELAIAAAGRQCLLIEGLPEDSGGHAFATARYFTVVQRTAQLRLDLASADRTRWQLRPAAGYRLAEWTSRAPAELLSSYAEARNSIREAPHGGLSFTEPEWTPRRVREEENTASASIAGMASAPG